MGSGLIGAAYAVQRSFFQTTPAGVDVLPAVAVGFATGVAVGAAVGAAVGVGAGVTSGVGVGTGVAVAVAVALGVGWVPLDLGVVAVQAETASTAASADRRRLHRDSAPAPREIRCERSIVIPFSAMEQSLGRNPGRFPRRFSPLDLAPFGSTRTRRPRQLAVGTPSQKLVPSWFTSSTPAGP